MLYLRDLSRKLEISRGSVENRLFRMAHWAIAAHSLACYSLDIHENLVADGFEGYPRSKYFQNHNLRDTLQGIIVVFPAGKIPASRIDYLLYNGSHDSNKQY
jgi:hypothetical protein